VIGGDYAAVSVHDGVLGSVLWYNTECSCECMISGLSQAYFDGEVVSDW